MYVKTKKGIIEEIKIELEDINYYSDSIDISVSGIEDLLKELEEPW